MLPLLSSTIYILIRSLRGVDARAVNTTITSLPTSDVSFSLLADAVNATAASQRCSDIDKCRTLNDIVRSCLVTILACAWFAVHRNIPAPRPMRSRNPRLFFISTEWIWRSVLDQKETLIVLLVALLVPELILAWAARQAIVAWTLAEKLEEARKKAINARTGQSDAAEITVRVEGFARSTPTGTEFEGIQLSNRRSNSSTAHPTCERCERNGNQCHLVADARRVAKGDECWTWLHGFFVAMGGFHFYNKDGPLYPLSPANVVELVARGHIIPPTADEISDRSKGDWLSKGVAILQTVWFVVQCIARHAEGLPVTRLEVMTLAYTVVTVAMYTAWWAKPLNVRCAVRVPEEQVEEEKVLTFSSNWEMFAIYITGWQDEYVDLRQCKRVPTFWAGKPSRYFAIWVDGFVLAVAMAFGAAHCIAWHSDFQLPLDQQLWRSSAIAIIAVPAVTFFGPVCVIAAHYPSPITKRGIFLLGFLMVPINIVYVAARIILVILSFRSLRALPFAAYQTVQWTTFIPHI